MWHDLIIYTPMYVTLFWAIALFMSKRQSNEAKHFLGVFMFTAFLLYASHAIFFNRLFEIYLFVEPVYIAASLSVYPLYYWYIKLLTIETKVRLSNLRSLLPALLLSLATSAVFLLMSGTERNLFIQKYLLHHGRIGGDPAIVKAQYVIYLLSRLAFAVQVIYFLVKGSRLVLRYNRRVANFYSNLESKTILWVNLLLFSFVVTSAMSIVFNVIGKAAFFERDLLLLIPSTIFSVLLFIIGLQGYMQNHTVTDLEIDELQAPEPAVTETAHLGEGLKKQHSLQIKEDLLRLFADKKIYKNPDLKITQVSALLRTNRTYLSNVINGEFSKPFSEFVNAYRIDESKGLLIDSSLKNYSLEFISEKSGFGSLSSFIRVFREMEGITPGKYRDKKQREQQMFGK